MRILKLTLFVESMVLVVFLKVVHHETGFGVRECFRDGVFQIVPVRIVLLASTGASLLLI